MELYKKYIDEPGQFLIFERDFRHKGTNKIKYITFGIVLDFLAYYFFKSADAFANKALIALHGNEIFEAARQQGVTVAFV